MVTTRTGPKLDRLVRFKKGVSVRKFLDFNSPSNWELTPESLYSDSADLKNNCSNGNVSGQTEGPVDNGHMTLNGEVDSSYSHDYSYEKDNSTLTNANRTIEYDTNVNLSSFSAVIWDTVVFLAFTLICYTIATFSCKYY